jgi:trehalose 6-phosphate synthase
MIVAQLSWRGWISGVRGLLRGEGLLRPFAVSPEVAPIAAELRIACATSKTSTGARSARRPAGTRIACAACCARNCTASRSSWSRTASRTSTSASRTAVVVKRPASGLVTAVEPVMRACSGTWIAHGSGDADRETVDSH